jgi:N-glycosylase/DNA lyase
MLTDIIAHVRSGGSLTTSGSLAPIHVTRHECTREVYGADEGFAQVVRFRRDDGLHCLILPPATHELMPGISWGSASGLFMPAFWKSQAWLAQLDGALPRSHALGNSLFEEIGACLLGNHGVPAEVAYAAFVSLRDQGFFEPPVRTADEFYTALKNPLVVGGRRVAYRFAAQKSLYLADSLHAASRSKTIPECPLRLRDWLATLHGIGLKTASWIVRNHTSDDRVAILDIHITRICGFLGLFSGLEVLPRDYRQLERRFLEFASAIDVPASILDALMWRDARLVGTASIHKTP